MEAPGGDLEIQGGHYEAQGVDLEIQGGHWGAHGDQWGGSWRLVGAHGSWGLIGVSLGLIEVIPPPILLTSR